VEKENKFRCQQCANCCKGHGITATPLELFNIKNLIARKKLPYTKFWRTTRVLEGYVDRDKDNRIFKIINDKGELDYATLTLQPKDEATMECIFLNKRTNRCDVYEARTFACRTYPQNGHATENCPASKDYVEDGKEKQKTDGMMPAQLLYERQILWWNNDENVPKEKKTIQNLAKYLGLE
jgi:Fe-S-cluster containining protein